jgi:hypothetical protein
MEKQYVLHIAACARECVRACVCLCVCECGYTGAGVSLCACSLTIPARNASPSADFLFPPGFLTLSHKWNDFRNKKSYVN